MDSFRRKMIRGEWFEIASWKSSDSIKSDLPIKSEGRSLKGFTSSHFFFLPSRAKVSKKNRRLTRLRVKDGGRAATYRKVERSIDPSNSLAGANFAYMAAPMHRTGRISLTIDRIAGHSDKFLSRLALRTFSDREFLY